MNGLPPIISPPPEVEAIELGLSARVFNPIDADAALQAKADVPEPSLRAYVLLDASASPDIAICLEAFNSRVLCLFDGQAQEDLSDVAPWLVELTPHSDAWDWFVEDGFGKNWGIILHSRLPIGRLKTHLKKFVRVEDEDGEIYYFKYYRPEHLNNFLPVFEPDQIKAFFAGTVAYLSEDRASPGALLIWYLNTDAALVHENVDLRAEGEKLMVQVADPAAAQAILAALESQDENQ